MYDLKTFDEDSGLYYQYAFSTYSHAIRKLDWPQSHVTKYSFQTVK